MLKATGKRIKAIRRPTRAEMKRVFDSVYFLDDFETRGLLVVELEDGTILMPTGPQGEEPGMLMISDRKESKLIEP